MRLDGRPLIAAFEVDPAEHTRRLTLGAGAVASRSVLHGLWLLPAGIPVQADEIPAVKRRRLRDSSHFAAETELGFERLYSPAGIVRAVAFAGSDPTRCVEQAIRFTPIVQRVVVTDPDMPASNEARRLALEFGVGIIEAGKRENVMVEQPADAVVGVPAVYRWWIAELAYEAWLQLSAQPVS
jgi:hypothetical protein